MLNLRIRTTLTGVPKIFGREKPLEGIQAEILGYSKQRFIRSEVSTKIPEGTIGSGSSLLNSKTAVKSSWNTEPRRQSGPKTFFTNFKNFNRNAFGDYKVSTSLMTKRYYSTKVSEQELPPHIQKIVEQAPTHLSVHNEEELRAKMKPQGEAGNYDKRLFTYFMLSGSRFIFTAGIRLLVLKFLYSLAISADARALGKVEVDVSTVPRGKTITVTWRGKPVFIRHRTQQEIEAVRSTPLAELKDPQSDEERTQNPDWIVVLAICTHLGCVPIPDAGQWNAFYCPCHGSHYDFSGRIMKGPAPTNLEVPEHKFIEGGRILQLG